MIIDEPDAEVVRYIYKLCLEGLGPTQIAKRLRAEKILCPTQREKYPSYEAKSRTIQKANCGA